jgi:hypothetical protein
MATSPSTTASSAFQGTVSCSKQRPSHTHASRACCARKRATSVLLPTPETPRTCTSTGRVWEVAKACASVSSGASRPTKGALAVGSAARPPSTLKMVAALGRRSASGSSSARHRSSRSAGMPTTRLEGRTAGAMVLRTMTDRASPAMGSRPVSASKSMTPTAYQSLAGVSGRASACSGDM